MSGELAAAESDVPRSRYREVRPPPALAAHVLCLWAQAIGAGGRPHPQRVLPDGCVDIVWIGEAPPVVAGPATTPVIVELPPSTILVGVRCHPGAASGLLGLPADEIRDREVPLGQIWGGGALELALRPGAETKVADKLALAAAALTPRVRHARPADPLVAAAVGWLVRHPGAPVERLSGLLDIGSRQLRRRFRASVGYGPKTLQRVLRLQRLLALAGRGPKRPALAALAADAGYADQAHMARELAALTGRAPTALLARGRSTLEMSDLFKTMAAADA